MAGNDKKKVGLALGGGSARGLAHIGVLLVLQREGIPIDMIAGTSAGALVGALYAREMDANLIKQQALSLDWRRLTALIDLTLPTSGFISGRSITRLLRTFTGGDIEFEDLKIPFACIASDIMTGEEVIIKEGSVLEAVRASISFPVIFTLARWKGRYLVDGGLTDPVPVAVVKQMGADFIIAVDVIPGVADVAKYLNKQTKNRKEPGLFTVLLQSLYMRDYILAEICAAGADFVIRPQVAHIGPGEFHRTEECIHQGELAAQESITRLKSMLGL